MADNMKFVVQPELDEELMQVIARATERIREGFAKSEVNINQNMSNISSSIQSNLIGSADKFKTKINEVTGSVNSGWKNSANIFKKSFNTNFRKIKIDWKKSIKEMNKNSKGLKPPQSMVNGWKKLGGVIAGALTINALKNFSGESIELYKAQSLVENKLKANMRTVKLYGGNTEKMNKAMENFKNMTSEIQEKGVIGDEVLLAGASQLTTFQLTDKAISKLLPKMADMAVNQKGLNATQEDMFGIANQLGKAISSGSLAALADSGIVIDENTKKMFSMSKGMDRINLLEKILAENVGNVNEEMAKTPEGQIQNAQNAWGDMKEEIGKSVIPVVVKFNELLKKNLPKIQKMLLSIAEKVPPAFEKIVAAGENIMRFLESLHKNIGIDNIIVFVGAFMAMAKIVPVIIGVVKVAKALRAGTLAMNSAFLANPIALVVGAIAVAGYMIYKNWDKITVYFSEWKEKFLGMWSGFKESFSNKLQGIKESFINSFDSAKESFNSFVDGALGMWEGFKNTFSGVIDFVKNLIIGYISIYQTMINAVIKGVNKVGKIMPGFSGIEEVDFVSKIKETLKVEEQPTQGFSKADLAKGTVVFDTNVKVDMPTNVSQEFKTEVTEGVKKATTNERKRKEREMGLT
ncbi:MAG: hypothetical protein ACRDDH_18045 [Cetobacterium sp.]|uniref:hypothetical protein n=1 Tax=Cetobacterium sp. TaxID=2071632 RepID=UPI003EE7FDF7